MFMAMFEQVSHVDTSLHRSKSDTDLWCQVKVSMIGDLFTRCCTVLATGAMLRRGCKEFDSNFILQVTCPQTCKRA